MACAPTGCNLGTRFDDVYCQGLKRINFVRYRQLQRCIDVAPFPIATHVHVVVIFTSVEGQSMDKPRIPAPSEDDRLVDGEESESKTRS